MQGGSPRFALPAFGTVVVVAVAVGAAAALMTWPGAAVAQPSQAPPIVIDGPSAAITGREVFMPTKYQKSK